MTPTVNVIKLSDAEIMRRACEMTMDPGMVSKISLEKMYRCKHSPIRTQMFWIVVDDVYTFVATHFVRHHVGCQPFVQSRREDRTAMEGVADRYTPVRMALHINAESLMNMSYARLCYQASDETRELMEQIKRAITDVDPALAKFMVPRCAHTRRCDELRPCGRLKEMLAKYPVKGGDSNS